MKKSLKFLLFISVTIHLLVSCSNKKVREEFDPKAMLQEATGLINDFEYEEARKVLSELKNRDLSQQYAPYAQIKIAESYVKEKEPDLAVNEYRAFLELFPDHSQAPYAQYQIALIYYTQIESPEKGAGGARRAFEEFQKLMRIYPRNPYREAVKHKIKKCRTYIAEYEFIVGKFYFKKSSYNAAAERFELIIKDFQDFKKMPEVLYFTGIAYRQLNKNDESLKYLNELRSRFPEDNFSKKAEEIISAYKE